MFLNDARFLHSRTPVPLLARVPFDTGDPLGLYIASRGAARSFLLDSGNGPGRPALGRYSFFGDEPYEVLSASEGRLTHWNRKTGQTVTESTTDPLRSACERLGPASIAAPTGAPPFLGGVVGCLGYGLSHRHWKPGTAPRAQGFPDLYWMFVDLVGTLDSSNQTLTVSFCPHPERFAGEPRTGLLQEGRQRLAVFVAAARHGAGTKRFPPEPRRSPPDVQGMSRDAYGRMVERAQAYIAAGDIFQANLAQRFSVTGFDADSVDVYGRLRTINPAPFSAFLELEHAEIMCSSPERLVRTIGREVETRPIAGTRPRGFTDDDDRRLTNDLLLNPKERAEHLMLLDLERNDLGRVCAYGSVKVDELMVTERYSHVMHIVSNIRGLLRPEISAFNVLDAMFPGGTVTGVPKIRCLEIIDELESVPRGLYTGSIGYMSWCGRMDWNIVIRTLIRRGETLTFHAGAGIVADSNADREYDETRHKAQALIDAVC